MLWNSTNQPTISSQKFASKDWKTYLSSDLYITEKIHKLWDLVKQRYMYLGGASVSPCSTPKQLLYGHLPPITKTIKVRRTRHAGHYWRSRDEPISDVLPWASAHGRAKAGRPARTYVQQLCEDTGCSTGKRGGERELGISVLMARQDDDNMYLNNGPRNDQENINQECS